MEISKKQAMHLEPGKSFGSAEANENERRWDEKKIDDKNRVPTNHYDKTRMHLNFEIGEDRKVHPLGFHRQNLDIRLEKRHKIREKTIEIGLASVQRREQDSAELLRKIYLWR